MLSEVDLDDVQVSVARLDCLCVTLSAQLLPSLLGNRLMDLLDTRPVLVRRLRKVRCFEHSPVDELAPVLAHLLLVN